MSAIDELKQLIKQAQDGNFEITPADTIVEEIQEEILPKISPLEELKNLLREAAPHYIPKEIVEESIKAEIETLSEKDIVQMTADLIGKSAKPKPDLSEDIESQRFNDPLRNTNFVTQKQMNDHYSLLLNRIQTQMSTIGGGGEVNLRMLDDVNRSTIADGLNMQYNSTNGKFDFTTPIVAVYAETTGANATLINSPTPIIIPTMTKSPAAGTYLVNFNSQFTVDDTSSQTLQAKEDMQVLYDAILALPNPIASHDVVFGNDETLYAGNHVLGGAISIAGKLILDAQDDPNALFVIRSSAGAFSTAANAEVELINGATTDNVWFVSAGAASTGADTIMYGNMLSVVAVSTGADTIMKGRMLSLGNPDGAIGLGARTILTTPTGVCQLPIGNVINLFNIFTGKGAITNTGASEIQLSIGTNGGTITGFDTATVGGSIIGGGSATLTVFRCAIYVDGVIIQDSLRSTSRPLELETFEFPIVLQTMLTLTEGQTVDVRAYSELGIQTVGPRMSFTLTRIQVQ